MGLLVELIEILPRITSGEFIRNEALRLRDTKSNGLIRVSDLLALFHMSTILHTDVRD